MTQEFDANVSTVLSATVRTVFLFISLLCVMGSLLATAFHLPKAPTLPQFHTGSIDGHVYGAFMIGSGSEFRVVVAASNTWMSLKELIRMRRGVAGMNGAYFLPRDYTGQSDTSNTLRVMQWEAKLYSKYYPDTGINGLFGLTASGVPLLAQNNLWWDATLRQNYSSWRLSEIVDGIANFPILIVDGVSVVENYRGNPVITEKMLSKSKRSFICWSSRWGVIMGQIGGVSVFDMPALLIRLGCVNAINLDNGGSSAVMRWEKYLVGPGRNIMDAFVIVRK